MHETHKHAATHMHTHTHTFSLTFTHTLTHIRTYPPTTPHTYIRTHTHTHTHTHTSTQLGTCTHAPHHTPHILTLHKYYSAHSRIHSHISIARIFGNTIYTVCWCRCLDRRRLPGGSSGVSDIHNGWPYFPDTMTKPDVLVTTHPPQYPSNRCYFLI